MKIRIQPGLDHISDRADLLQDFVVFVCKDLQCMPCPIDIVNGRGSSGLKTTAQYDPNNPHVMVNAKNRHFGDVLRSVAHELVHHKQNLSGELDAPVQDIGGHIEDEANARAGALLKSFAYQKGPERIYEGAKLLSDYVRAVITEETTSPPSPVKTALSAAQRIWCRSYPNAEICKPGGGKDEDGKGTKKAKPVPGCEQDGLAVGKTPLTDNSSFSNPVPGALVSTSRPFSRKPLLNPVTKKMAPHKGIDMSVRDPDKKQSRSGIPVISIGDGVVYRVRKNHDSYGNVVEVNYLLNGKPYRALYAHLDKVSAVEGECAGAIGTIGNTGRSRGAHLHLELYKGMLSLKRKDKETGQPIVWTRPSTDPAWRVVDPTKLPGLNAINKERKQAKSDLKAIKKRRAIAKKRRARAKKK